ncbi:MAG: type IX secretion system sortase PorU [Cyclobacteriaceae bacterium]|nr:type IX secretion system sortase PorU [Cyclobacteriaceae bacterium]MDH4294893.1 type IX secretion system sortase PorU [Cyclobacteriaceae bacterium]MDH5248761.1 type IX secretion system sortase PorU [Cyclobacteriaceae bacterium]
MLSVSTIRLVFVGFLAVQISICDAQSSVLESGTWYKLGIEKQGVYKITYDQFKKMGFDPSATDPRKIKIYGNEGGMLPQPNSTSRPVDLFENSILISGEGDGSFDKNDFILFYAKGPDRVQFDLQRNIFSYEHNLYSEKNFYFITLSADNGKRVLTSESIEGNFPVIEQFEDYVYHESDEYNELHSGREWFGERYDLVTDYAYQFDVSGVVPNSTVKLVSDVMAQSFNESSFDLLFNKVPIGEQVVPIIANTQYSIKGRHKRDTLLLDANTIAAPGKAKQEVQYHYNKASSGRSVGFLDFLLINFTRTLALYGDQTTFRSIESLAQTISQYRINAPENCTIWDVTNPGEIKQQRYTWQNGVATFSTSSAGLKEFIIFNSTIPSPALAGSVPNQNLHGFSPANLILITHPNFSNEAQRLASHRQAQNNWSTVVVTPEEIFNEYSSGRQDVTAIRDFVKSMYDKNPAVLKALLIMGRGSYDYKDRMPNNTNFVPTYESRNSLAPLETYSSDDYFAFLENDEGNWDESPAQNSTLDIGVGRLPVKTATEAKNVVDKIIAYDTNKKNFNRWRKDIVFVADDGNNADGFSSTHQYQANTMAEAIESIHPAFDTKKIFLGIYPKTTKPNGEVIPEANKDITSWFDRGSLIINYTGHGSERLWADEKIFVSDDIIALENKRYPFLVTATCEFGRQDDPADISSAELSVIQPNGGAIGLVSTARPVNSATNFLLNQEFYISLFEKESNSYLTLGEIFRRTKNNSMSGVSNRNFSLLADPSMRLALPSDSITISELKTATGSDTLKALSTVIVKGEIQDETGARLNSFNGTLEATLFDKAIELTTTGENDPPFKFNAWTNALYRGKATIENGAFEFQFIMPNNLADEIGKGKLSLYASDPQQGRDAGGTTAAFSIGGIEKSPEPDAISPTVELFMGDTTFINGGVTTPNTILIAKLHDASGINISNYSIENTLIAVLDNEDQVFVLSDYYESETNDFTRGWVYFPLKGLAPGGHSITVRAWDTYNNPGQATINFIVTDGQILVIETLGNIPNPFQNETKLFFTHNRSGDDLQGQLYIYSITGQVMKTYDFDIPDSPYHVDLLEINGLTDFGKKLPGGVYLARLAVRSLTNGAKSERVTKLIVVN